MKFRTEIPTPQFDKKITYDSSMLLMGSCFSSNIHDHLTRLKFNSISNPFGIVYNPLALSKQINILCSNKEYSFDELQMENERWFSFDHHSDFSNTDKNECLGQINSNLTAARQRIKTANYLFITLGTSWVYRLKDSNEIVSNCHKLPAKKFLKELIPVETMETELLSAISNLKSINPNLSIVFSISPIRHLSDGFFENQVSKGRLFDTIYRITKEDYQLSYFPAYELVLDDLRDYRFYKSDLVHPSIEAVEYIWDKFKESFLSLDAVKKVSEVEKLINASNHRPFNPSSEAHQKFIKSTIEKMEALNSLNFHKEIERLKSHIC
ncbi:MAG: GSCFA domain-containing protein [Salibacteraceae bacterium]